MVWNRSILCRLDNSQWIFNSFYNIKRTLSNLIIVVTQSTRKFVVIHICFIFSHSPKFRNLFRSMEFKFAIFWSPADQVRWIFRIHQEFKKELPESDVDIETTNLIHIFNFFFWYTVVRTNKGRTNKGQITFFRKIYWGLIRDKFLEKFSTKQNITDFFISTDYFWRKSLVY